MRCRQAVDTPTASSETHLHGPSGRMPLRQHSCAPSADKPPEDNPIRACTCSFCRSHNPRMLSDPDGSFEVQADDWSLVERYRFGTRTCDFLICRRCGVFIAAVAEMSRGRSRCGQCELPGRSRTLHLGPDDARVSGRDDRQQIVAARCELDAGDSFGAIRSLSKGGHRAYRRASQTSTETCLHSKLCSLDIERRDVDQHHQPRRLRIRSTMATRGLRSALSRPRTSPGHAVTTTRESL